MYQRVLPRDAFNEANLLKCIGQLTLLVLDKPPFGLTYEYDGQPFDIRMDDCGELSVSNIQFYLNNEPVFFTRPLNSRAPWPLYEAETGNPVFDDNGNYILTL